MIHDILREVSGQVRKGAMVEQSQQGGLAVTDVFDMPARDEVPNGMQSIDMVFIDVAVNAAAAEHHRAGFIEYLNTLPADVMAGGPSYIHLGGLVGDQGAALELMAVGEVLGLWKVITPYTLGVTDPQQAKDMAGQGFVLISGYRQ